jgi:hypothetical protein
MSVEPRFEQTAIRTDLGAIFVSLELSYVQMQAARPRLFIPPVMAGPASWSSCAM